MTGMAALRVRHPRPDGGWRPSRGVAQGTRSAATTLYGGMAATEGRHYRLRRDDPTLHVAALRNGDRGVARGIGEVVRAALAVAVVDALAAEEAIGANAATQAVVPCASVEVVVAGVAAEVVRSA